jgi:hypothetical protein
VHPLLRYETLCLAQAHLRLALVVDDDDGDLGAAEAGQALSLGKRQRQVGALIDDLQHGLHGRDRVDADLRCRS